MHQSPYKIVNSITSFIDFFYPPFRFLMPPHIFRYAVCGSTNCIITIFLYHFAYVYIFHETPVHVFHFVVAPYIAADYFFALWISFLMSFLLNRYLVFQESTLKKRVQLFRLFLVSVSGIFLNYLCLKLFIGIWGLPPTIGKILTTIVTIGYSYLAQRYYSFKIDKKGGIHIVEQEETSTDEN